MATGQATRRSQAHLLGGERDDLLLHETPHAGQPLRQPVHAGRHTGQAAAEGGARDVHEVRQAPAPEHAQVDVPDARCAHRVQQHRALPARWPAKSAPQPEPGTTQRGYQPPLTLCWRRPWRWLRPAACAHPWTAAPPAAAVGHVTTGACIAKVGQPVLDTHQLVQAVQLSVAGCSVPAGHVPQLPAHEQGPDSPTDIHTVVVCCGATGSDESACSPTAVAYSDSDGSQEEYASVGLSFCTAERGTTALRRPAHVRESWA